MADAPTWTPPATDKVNAGTGWTPPASDAITSFGDLGSAYNLSDAMNQKQAVESRNRQRKQKQDFIVSNKEQGVPLDTESGLPAGIRARLSLETDPDKQADLLSKQEGIISTRKSKDGSNIIARVDDGSGGKKDVLLHPMNANLTLGDIAGSAAPIAKTGAAVGLAALTEGASLPLTAAIMGTGTAATHAALEGGSRLAAGQDLDAAQIAKEATEEGAINAAIPAVAAAAKPLAKGAQKLFTGGAGALEQAVPKAAENLGVPTTPSMVTGSKVLARAEKAADFSEQDTAQKAALKAAEDRQLGMSGAGAVPSEQQVAEKVQPLAQKAADTAQAGVNAAKNQAATAAQQQIQATLDAGLVPSNLSQTDAGSFLRQKLAAYAAKVKAEADKNYPAFFQKAEEKGITLDAKPVSDLVAQIAKEDPRGAAELLSPSIKQVKAVEGKLNPTGEAVNTGILDARGNPIMQAPEAPPPLGFQEAINLRAIVRQKLNSAVDPLGDVVKRYYNKLDNALTETIENGLKQDKSGELQKLYDTARGSYSEGAQALEQGKLPKLFANAGDPGYVADDKIVPSLFGGSGNLDALKAWKAVLQPGEYKLLLRQGVKGLMDQSQGTNGFIDAGKFLGKIDGLSPEVRQELLGPIAKDVTSNAKLLDAARGARISADDLDDALQSAPGAAPTLLKQAFEREKIFEKQYNNSVQQALRGGRLGPSTLGNVDTFTADWLGKAGAEDARNAMMQISQASPETAELVRQRALKNILDSSRAAPELGQISTGGNPAIDPSKLAKYLSGPEREKYQAVLGRDGIQFLDDLNTISEANAKRIAQGAGKPLTAEGNAERVGAIVGGNELSLMREAGRGALNLALAVPGKLMKNEAVANYLKTGEMPALSPAVRTAVLAAPEVVNQTRKSDLKTPPVAKVLAQ